MPYVDPEKNVEFQRQYHAQPKHRRIAVERVRRRRKDNPDKWKAQQRVNNYRRRIRRFNAPVGDPILAADYEGILRQGICEQCGAHGPIELDHIDPLSSGGEHGWPV